MARIIIKDLPADIKFSKKELKRIRGGGKSEFSSSFSMQTSGGGNIWSMGFTDSENSSDGSVHAPYPSSDYEGDNEDSSSTSSIDFGKIG